MGKAMLILMGQTIDSLYFTLAQSLEKEPDK